MPETRQTPPAISRSLLAVEKVSKTYADGQVHALRNVSFEIGRGEFLSIMGKSGCGKSTLLNMLGALDRPTQGEVYFDGKPLSKIGSLDKLRASQIGFVFQSFYLLPNLTALENVQLPMFQGQLSLTDRVRRAESLLEQVGLAERKRHQPYQLSIGQRQRVAIARAMANEPAIILADEPTGSLDSQSGSDVMDLMQALNRDQQTTLVVVTHDEGIAAYGKRVIRMVDGRIEDDKTFSEQQGS